MTWYYYSVWALLFLSWIGTIGFCSLKDEIEKRSGNYYHSGIDGGNVTRCLAMLHHLSNTKGCVNNDCHCNT